ncbi:MAG TPA: hypothetical protein VJ901_04865 [Thermoanaerobaculia bacterium]|jgi:hypothetical protein|nr:hypothetical protein [Thermoanaerobaculia bacterium]
MIRPALRIASALIGLVIISVSAGAVHSPLGLIVAGMGVLFLLPLFVSWRAPRVEDFEWLTEWVNRLRTAMVVCYGTALWIYLMVLASQRAHTDNLQRLASLGAAFWMVGFVAMFFTAYFASRRSAVARQIE